MVHKHSLYFLSNCWNSPKFQTMRSVDVQVIPASPEAQQASERSKRSVSKCYFTLFQHKKSNKKSEIISEITFVLFIILFRQKSLISLLLRWIRTNNLIVSKLLLLLHFQEFSI